MDKIKYVVLTGATGFLGSFVLRKLIEDGLKPILIIRQTSNTWRIKNLLQHCEIFILNDRRDNIDELMRLHQVDCIIHLATDYGRSSTFTELLMTNVLLPLSLLEVGLKYNLKLFINTDSFFAKPHFTQDYLKDYTNSKRILESILEKFSGNVHIVNLRIEHVYGENDSEQKFFTSIIKKLIHNEAAIELTEGNQKRDFIYAEDVANAYSNVIKEYECLGKYEEFQIGTGNSISVQEFVKIIADAMGSDTKLNFGALPSRSGDIPDSYAEIGRLQKIRWSPTYGIKTAINKIINIEKERFKL